MAILTIKDLSMTKDLDEKAMTTVRGGSNPSLQWSMPDIPMNLDAMMGTYLGGGFSDSGTAVSTEVSSTPPQNGEIHGTSTTTVTKTY